MNRTTKIIGAAVACAVLGMGSAAWADCGVSPTPPAIPADGSGINSKEMEKIAKEFDAYQSKFIEVNDCVTKEYNDSQAKFKAAIDAYSAKNKKK